MDEIFPIEGVRKFILGLQGLWPGRRWAGQPGVLKAFENIQAVQMDPLNVVARSHDLVLHARVKDYAPAQLNSLLYEQRALFDYGGGLFIYPLEELPYWRVAMRNKGQEPRWARFAASNPGLLEEIRAAVRRRGPLRSRDFENRSRVTGYRASKDSGMALYYLWLTGELMTSSRVNFERVYDLSENLAPARLLESASEEEAMAFFGRKALAFHGLVNLREWKNFLSGSMEKKIDLEDARTSMEKLLASGEAVRIRVEGWREPVHLLDGHLPFLVEAANGQVPDAWRSLDAHEEEVVLFLAPLDIVSARGRARALFGFDYLWEVYKPVHKRRWGYYTLPVLYGDRLPARIDLKLLRPERTLRVEGFWLEDAASAGDERFVSALAGGLEEMMVFTGAERVELNRLEPASLRQQLETLLKRRS